MRNEHKRIADKIKKVKEEQAALAAAEAAAIQAFQRKRTKEIKVTSAANYTVLRYCRTMLRLLRLT